MYSSRFFSPAILCLILVLCACKRDKPVQLSPSYGVDIQTPKEGQSYKSDSTLHITANLWHVGGIQQVILYIYRNDATGDTVLYKIYRPNSTHFLLNEDWRPKVQLDSTNKMKLNFDLYMIPDTNRGTVGLPFYSNFELVK